MPWTVLRLQPKQVADQHRAARAVLADRVTRDSLALWRRMDIVELDASWNTIGPAIGRVVTLGQVDAARQTATFMQGVERITPTRFPGVDLAVESFGGVTLAGRDVTAEAFGAVATTKGLISQGVRSGDAFLRGAMSLAVLVGAAVQDMGRQADMTLATAKGFTSYVRVVSAGACSRCAILAGKEDYRTPFLRHPRCRCTTFPVQSDGATPDGMFSNSGAYFESLSPGEQNRVFTNAGAEAIRNGADPSKVVNARRGYFGSKPAGVPVRRLRPVQIGVRPDGSPLTVFATGEGTTVRGAFGRAETQASAEAARQGSYRQTTSVRLMPEQIVRMAGDNRERLVELLQRYGYLY
jgi:hypothetical protein